jgi:ubiquinone/menaquinone biosynthesis C-methylase UbiE
VQFDYEELYRRCAEQSESDEQIVGDGYDWIGDVELAVLQKSGLRPTDTLVDFGCGTGRLAVKVIPVLNGGAYVGIEVARNILDRAERNVAAACPEPPCALQWLHNPGRGFPLDDASVDMICAFSVFTHLEHEDTYVYLSDARRVIKPQGRFVYSCLPLELDYSQAVFRDEAARELGDRWAKPRNVATSRELMDQVARLAGWKPVRWWRGDTARFGNAPDRRHQLLGQSVCVLERA